VQQESSYYPFGLEIEGLSWQKPLQKSLNKYLYNGKELQDDLGLDWYDYGARFYDAQIGRWHSVDPMSEERNWVSPYNYVQNNPIMRIDPNGMLDDDYGVDKKGNITLLKKTNDNHDVLYAVDDKGNKKDTDGDGKVSEKDGQKVNDRKLLPTLATTNPRFIQRDYWGKHTRTWAKNPETGKYGYTFNHEMLQGHAGFTSSKSDAINVFTFAAANSKVEWALEGNNSGMWFVGTLHSNGQAPNSNLLPLNSNLERKGNSIILHTNTRNISTVNIIGFEPSALKYSAHSHPDATVKDFSPSNGDIRAATYLRERNSNVRIRLFMPQNPKTKWTDY